MLLDTLGINEGQGIPVRTLLHAMQSTLKDAFAEFDPSLTQHALAHSLDHAQTLEVPLTNI